MSKEFDKFMESVKALPDYPELEGTMNLCEDIIEKKTGKMTEEEWQAAERAQIVPKISDADYIDRHIIESMVQLAKEGFKPSLEISDEEIALQAYKCEQYEFYGAGTAFEQGAKWYREQLKRNNEKE
jgi:hypothetical protein